MAVTRQPRLQSKTAEVYQALYDFALARKPHEKLPTTRELCEILNSSRTTINQALNILEAQDVLYRKQSSGVYVSPKLHRKTIYILLYSHLFQPEANSPFWGMLWSLLAREAEQRMVERNEHYSFHLVLQSQYQVPEELLLAVNLKKIHGVLSIGGTPAMYQWLAEHEIPSVTFAGWGHWNVFIGWRQSVSKAVDMLVEQGCRSIGYWNGNDPYNSIPFPIEIFQNAVASHGLLFNPAFFQRAELSVSATSPNYQQQGYQLAYQVFGTNREARPDGLIIDNDMVTAGMLIAFQELGIQVDQDVKVASHANTGSPVLFGYHSKLIHIEYDPIEIVQAMFAALDEMLAGNVLKEGTVRIHPRIYK